MSTYTAIRLLLALSLVGCTGSDHTDIVVIQETASSNGHIAILTESRSANDSLTQVAIEFSGGKCWSGAASIKGTGHILSITWSSPTELVITNPQGAKLTRNASGEHIQCGNHIVHVSIQSPNDTNRT